MNKRRRYKAKRRRAWRRWLLQFVDGMARRGFKFVGEDGDYVRFVVVDWASGPDWTVER